MQLGVLLVQNLITLSHEEEPGTSVDEEILEEYEEAVAESDNEDEDDTTNQDGENRLLLNEFGYFTVLIFLLIKVGTRSTV